MRCRACNYYHCTKDDILAKDGVLAEDLRANNGEDAFIKVDFKVDVSIDFQIDHDAELYACPNCGTIILKHYLINT